MTTPKATIRYIEDLKRRTSAEAEIQCEQAIELSLLVMRQVRELNRNGSLVLYVEFLIDGQARRYYPSGRRRVRWAKKYRTGK